MKINPEKPHVDVSAEVQTATAHIPTSQIPAAAEVLADLEQTLDNLDPVVDEELRKHYGSRYDDAVALLNAGKTRAEVDATLYACDPVDPLALTPKELASEKADEIQADAEAETRMVAEGGPTVPEGTLDATADAMIAEVTGG